MKRNKPKKHPWAAYDRAISTRIELAQTAATEEEKQQHTFMARALFRAGSESIPPKLFDR